jgi:NADH-quinone oxidoreductase subunit J
MTMAQALFYVLAFIALASGVFVASSNSLVRSVFMFFVTLMAIAGLYVLCLADFVAITQIVIYVGGILVLIIFAFMLSGEETLANLQQGAGKFISLSKVPALLLAVLFFIVMLNIILQSNIDNMPWLHNAVARKDTFAVTDPTIGNIGVNLMTTYLLPFEAISILLLMALVGAAHLSRKEKRV